ncbi:hypothetical protein ACFQ3K_02395 [Brucella gallinifaecis]|uniref:hypothetical protein n=1 Tax=Brucella gallinifaecis TaxID=215590 RepID=UPI001456AEAA|nr:hypothetical protein [Brucella gallinifaecis]
MEVSACTTALTKAVIGWLSASIKIFAHGYMAFMLQTSTKHKKYMSKTVVFF